MSLEEFEDNCVLCRPVLIDPINRRIVPDDDPMMQVILKVWGETTLEQRQAWHHITCSHSLDPVHHEMVRPFIEKLQAAVAEFQSRQVSSN